MQRRPQAAVPPLRRWCLGWLAAFSQIGRLIGEVILRLIGLIGGAVL